MLPVGVSSAAATAKPRNDNSIVRAIDKGCLQKDDRPQFCWAVNPKPEKTYLLCNCSVGLSLAARINEGYPTGCELPAEGG